MCGVGWMLAAKQDRAWSMPGWDTRKPGWQSAIQIKALYHKVAPANIKKCPFCFMTEKKLPLK